MFLLTVPAFLIYLIILRNKIKNKNKIIEKEEKNRLLNLEKIKAEINNYENEINLIENNNKKLENEINNLKNSLILKINFEKEKIKNNYLDKLSKNENNYFNEIEKNEINKIINLENVNFEIENLQNEINNKKLQLHSLELDRKNIEPKLDNLANIEEELVNNNQKMSTLQKINLSFELAKNVLEKSYEEMRNNVTPRFTQELSKNISEITNGKYSNINLNEEQGLIVELENGNYVSASKLSIGTIDQLYLSLRLSMVEELSDENMPIILDEAFAYYDTERLKNILEYINKKFKKNQIIIFTCTNREKEILEKLEIKFNNIELK